MKDSTSAALPSSPSAASVLFNLPDYFVIDVVRDDGGGREGGRIVRVVSTATEGNNLLDSPVCMAYPRTHVRASGYRALPTLRVGTQIGSRAMATSAHQVAAELRARLPGLLQKQLQKLLYYCQGYHIAASGEPLFREGISAWDMGPVVPSVWKYEREHGIKDTEPVNDEAVLNTIGYVVSRYGGLSGAELEILTHGEPPWRNANQVRAETGKPSAPISPAALKEYFGRGSVDDEGLAVDSLELERLLRRSTSRQLPDAPIDTWEELNALLDVRA